MSVIAQKGFDKAEKLDTDDDESFFQQDDPSKCDIEFENKEAKDEYVGTIVNLIEEEKKGTG